MSIKFGPFVKMSTVFLIAFFQLHYTYAQQKSYRDSILSYEKDYVDTHEVVSKDDRKYISFYPIDKSYCVTASFNRIVDKTGFYMITSSGAKQKYFKYGLLTFRMRNKILHLYLYESDALMRKEKYKDYVFIPFGDATSGFTSYGGGRYLDFTLGDIRNNKLIIDFNKAYNPYCAYTSGYNCPIPPKENLLTVAIPAGEKNYGKPIH